MNVVNYSQGGRSLKAMYQEGRLNDILLRAKEGDYLFLQSGHNDESRDAPKGIGSRFGRGNTAESFEEFLRTYFLPAIRARGVRPVLVSCMTRLDSSVYSADRDFDGEEIHLGGFLNGEVPHIDFPGLMIRAAEREGLPYIDLYHASIDYLQSIGGNAAKAKFLSLEPGETPGKTNSGSYANGHPSGKCDCTHYRESLSKEFARIVVTQSVQKRLFPSDWVRPETMEAVEREDFSVFFPEKVPDIAKGTGAYYCDAIEKMLQAGVMRTREDELFHPDEMIGVEEFAGCLERCWGIRLPAGFHAAGTGDGTGESVEPAAGARDAAPEGGKGTDRGPLGDRADAGYVL